MATSFRDFSLESTQGKYCSLKCHEVIFVQSSLVTEVLRVRCRLFPFCNCNCPIYLCVHGYKCILLALEREVSCTLFAVDFLREQYLRCLCCEGQLNHGGTFVTEFKFPTYYEVNIVIFVTTQAILTS